MAALRRPGERCDSFGAMSKTFPDVPETGALVQSEERFRLLVESVRDYAIFMLDPQGHVVTWNAGAERIKGYARRRDHRPALLALLPAGGARRAGWPAHELEVAQPSGRFEDEGWRVRKDGTLFWANVVITALRDATGTLRRLRQGHARPDRATRRTRRRCARARSASACWSKASRDYAIFMLDANGHVATWNAGARAHQGLRRRRDHRPALLDLLSRRTRVESGWPEHELQVAAERRPLRGRGLAGAQGRHPLLGQRHHHGAARRAGAAASASPRSPAT